MKKILFLLYSLTVMITIDAQLNPKSEAEFKKYILSQIEDYDPIIGIFILKAIGLHILVDKPLKFLYQ